MDSRDNLSELVNNFIKKYNINHGNFDDIKPRLKEQLLQIESCIQEVLKTRHQIAVAIKDSKLSENKIATVVGLSRTHIANNKDILKNYIEGRVSEIESNERLSFERSNKQKEDVEFVKEWLERTQESLVEMEVYKLNIKALENENRELNKRIVEDLEVQLRYLMKENEQLKHELRKNGTNLVTFNPKNN